MAPAQGSSFATPPMPSAPLSLSSHPLEDAPQAEVGGAPLPAEEVLNTLPVLLPSSPSADFAPLPVLSPKERAQLADASLGPVCVIELWAGIGSLSSSCSRLGWNVVALCEKEDLLLRVLARLHPDAQLAGSFESAQWKLWDIPAEALVIVVGGPSCVSLSKAGKQGFASDPSSKHISNTLRVAAFFKASFVVIENVPELLELDSIHGLRSAALAEAASFGLLSVGHQLLRDSEVGGFTQRRRFFDFFESTSVSARLPPWQPLSLPTSLPADLPSILLHEDDLDLGTLLQVRCEQAGSAIFKPSSALASHLSVPAVADPYRSLRVGTLFWQPDRLALGAHIALVQHLVPSSFRTTPNRWVILDFGSSSCPRLLVRSANSAHPTTGWVSYTALSCFLQTRIPVYSADRPAVTLRHYGDPPLGNSFALLRGTSPDVFVTSLAPLEMWRAHGLSDHLAQTVLAEGGLISDLGKIAGNCVTVASSDAMIGLLGSRVDSLRALTHSSPVATLLPVVPEWVPPSGWSDLFGLRESHSSLEDVLVVLIPVVLDPSPVFLVKSNAVIAQPIRALDRGHSTALVVARKLASSTFREGLVVVLSARLDHPCFRDVLVFALPLPSCEPSAAPWLSRDSLSPETKFWCASVSVAMLLLRPPPTSSTDTALESPGLRAWQSAQQSQLTSVARSGKSLKVRRVLSKSTPSGASLSWLNSKRQLILGANQLLRVALLAEARLCTLSVKRSLVEWSDRVAEVPWSELPAELQPELDTFSDSELLLLPFPTPCPVADTDWLPLQSQQLPPPGFNPLSIADLLMPAALAQIEVWVETQLLFLLDIRTNGSKAVRTSNKPLALGQDCFTPQARGIVWDLRSLDQGKITPLDFHTPLTSHLNLELIAQELASYPDQELLSFLLEGVRYKTDLELQIVLLPHLISLRDGYDSLLDEVERYKDSGWYGLFDHPPFLPFRCIPKGSVPRKLELRPRPITDAGAPRSLLHDTEGVLVRSTNHSALGLPPQQLAFDVPSVSTKSQKWPHENKPSLRDLLTSLVALNAVAALIREPVFIATDDFKNFFNQLRTAPETWWQNCLIVSDYLEAKYATEYIMTFGVSPASNVAQRFAESLIFIFCKRFFLADAPFLLAERLKFPALEAWHASRLHLDDPSNQAQLATFLIYTDDPVFAVVGASRMARALRVWTEMVQDLGLIMAIPAKRQIGSHVFWIGAGVLAPLAMAWVPRQKALSAIERLDRVVHRPLPDITVGEYHSLIGLLEHLVFINGMRRNVMYGLWRPFQLGYMPEPNLTLVATPLMIKQAHSWRHLLTTRAVVSGLRMLTAQPTYASAPLFTITSDAADEPNWAGLGGWCHGLFWNFELPNALLELDLHITVLELVASIVSVCTFAEAIPSLCGAQTVMNLHSRADATSTVSTLADDSTHSLDMQVAHAAALEHPAYLAVLPSLSFSHIFGLANELADAASRNDLARLMGLASQLRIKPRRLEPSPVLQHIMTSLAKECRSRSALQLENATAMAQANTPTSASFVKLHASAAHLVAFGLKPKLRRERRAERATPRAMRASAPPDLELRPPLASVPSIQRLFGKATSKGPKLHTTIICSSSAPSSKPRRSPAYSCSKPLSAKRKVRLFSLGQRGRNQGTVANESGHWRKYWEPFCRERGVHPLRDDRLANSGADHTGYCEEVELLSDFLVYVLKHMKPKGGRLEALPASAVGVVRGILRIARKQTPPVEMVPFKALLPVLKGLTAEYKAKHTYRALLPRRKEPWRMPWLSKIMALRHSRSLSLGGFTWDDPLLMTSYFALLEVLAQTGFRRSEVAVRHRSRFDPSSHLTRASLLWCLGGVVYADSSEAQLNAATENDYALLTPPCSKTDEMGVIWGDKPIPLPFRFNAPYCAASRLRELELLMPLHGHDRLSSPLLLMAPGVPFTYHYLDKMLVDVKLLALPDTVDHSLFTYHSFRITLATQLGNVTSMKISNLDIQALCRWQSEQSLIIYKRMQPASYIRMLDAAMGARITSYQTSSLPMIDSADLLRGIEASLE